MAVSDRSPPDSKESLRTFLPDGRASTSMPVLSMSSGSVSRSRPVPPGMLEEVFALNEELDEVREQRAGGAPAESLKSRLERARQPIEGKRVEHEAQLQELSARWDATGDRAVLEALRDRILERNYITNLLAGIERELNS